MPKSDRKTAVGLWMNKTQVVALRRLARRLSVERDQNVSMPGLIVAAVERIYGSELEEYGQADAKAGDREGSVTR